jgi:hypothetical protein
MTKQHTGDIIMAFERRTTMSSRPVLAQLVRLGAALDELLDSAESPASPPGAQDSNLALAIKG